ncbi:MAG: hypothetical protein J5I93_25270 [Pirellulaceae bacterium]|nr:hypothetical protein [Pirellulaceae bacterium]
MRTTCSMLCAVVLLASATRGEAEGRATLVRATKVCDQQPTVLGSDLVRFGDRWFAVQLENHPAQARVFCSTDGADWEAVASLASRTPNRGVGNPRFGITADGQLMLTAVGVVPNPYAEVPVPMYGGTLNTLGWFSKDGRTWGTPQQIGQANFPFSGVVWDNGVAYSYGCGCICGSAQTIQLFTSTSGRRFESRYEETFSGFFPEEASVVLQGERAICLMSRSNGMFADEGRQTGYLGVAQAPYANWKWKAIDGRIKYPNLIRLPDERIVVAVALVGDEPRTVLCELDATTGALTELLAFPTGGKLQPIGLALHDGQLWASYHAGGEGMHRLHLAQIQFD